MPSTQSQRKGLDLASAASKVRQVECIAAAYRILWYACRGSTPPGNYHNLPEADKPRWRADGMVAAKCLTGACSRD